MANEIKDIGNGTGYLYITNPAGTILQTLKNSTEGTRNIILDAVYTGIIPWEVFQNTTPNPPLNYDADPDFGHRYWIYANVAAVVNSLAGATEITHYIVNKGLQSNLRVERDTIAAGSIQITRKGAITNVHVDTQGGAATDDLDSIDQDEFIQGDILILKGTDAARIVTVKDGTGNITLDAGKDFNTGNAARGLVLHFRRANKTVDGDWLEMCRSLAPEKTIAELRALGFPAIDDGVDTVAITYAGITYTRTAGTSKRVLRLTGAGTLLGNVVVTGDPSPKEGDSWIVQWRGVATIGAFNVTMFGYNLTSAQALSGAINIEAWYDAGTASYYIQLYEDRYSAATDNLYYAEVSIPTASVLTLNATPITIVGAQGAGKAIIPVDPVGQLTYNSVAYATNGALNLLHETASDPLYQWGTSFLFGTTTKTAFAAKQVINAVADTQIIANKALIAQVATGDPTAGDSGIKIKTYYRVLDV